MSFQAMTWATEQKLPAMQKIVLLMLANRTNHETGLCIPKIKTLADECGMSVRACQQQIAALVELGLLSTQTRFKEAIQLSNQYQLRMHGVQNMHPPMHDMRASPAGGAGGRVHNVHTEPGSINQEVNQSSAGKPAPVDNFVDARIVEHLNNQSGRKFQAIPATLKLIRARRLKDGFSIDDICEVIDRKCKEWKGTKMEQYLRPETLFNATKFAGYAGQRGMELRQDSNGDFDAGARWWESSSGIDQEGALLGVKYKTGEAFWQYKCRVAKASKQREAMDAILADMIRTENTAYEETARYFGQLPAAERSST